jgi:crotonobetainyl-CoA:carnitine CoA-transferase CaiB-like acyl-CoA transferase
VVECGDGVAAAYATKLLANLGADVVKVEPPSGDTTRARGPSFQGGVHAAVASMGALLGRRRLGGVGQYVEVSIQECLSRFSLSISSSAATAGSISAASRSTSGGTSSSSWDRPSGRPETRSATGCPAARIGMR